jgi:hypothetical protein
MLHRVWNTTVPRLRLLHYRSTRAIESWKGVGIAQWLNIGGVCSEDVRLGLLQC